MAEDWGHRIADYAWKYVKGPLATEFDERLDEWQVHTKNLIAYAKRALKNYEGHLEQIKKKVEAEQQKRQQFAMLALSLMASPALSFVAATLAQRLGPKLFGSAGQLPNRKHVPPPPVPREPSPPARPWIGGKEADRHARDFWHQKDLRDHVKKLEDYNKAKAMDNVYISHAAKVIDQNLANARSQMLGEVGARLMADLLVNPFINHVATAGETKAGRSKLQNAINRIQDSVDLDLLEANLNEAWVEAKKVCKQQMESFADTFNQNRTWGDDFLFRLRLDRNTWGMNDQQLDEYGCAQIRSIVDKQREMWAKEDKWFYYANAPATVSQPHFINEVEAQMWALWIATEDFQPATSEVLYGGHGKLQGEHRSRTVKVYARLTGRSGIKLDEILPRLRYLGVLEGHSTLELPRRSNPDNQPGVLKIEVDDIDGEVDTEAELNSIRNWAANRKPVIFGKLASVPRPMGPLPITGLF